MMGFSSPAPKTYPLDMFAAFSADRKHLTVAMVNATETAQKVDMDVTGVRIAGPATLWQMTGRDLDAGNRVELEPQVVVRETAIGDSQHTLTVAPVSVNIYEFQVAPTAQ